jgi:hypothetical protein
MVGIVVVVVMVLSEVVAAVIVVVAAWGSCVGRIVPAVLVIDDDAADAADAHFIHRR